MIGLVAKLLKILASEAENWQLALAISLSFSLAILPLISLQFVLFLLVVCLLRVNMGTVLLFLPVFLVLDLAISPLSHGLGEFLLTLPNLAESWTSLYQQDWFRLARLNHTTVLGSTLIAVAALLPVYVFSLMLVRQYRNHFMAWVSDLKVSKLLRTSELFQRFSGA